MRLQQLSKIDDIFRENMDKYLNIIKPPMPDFTSRFELHPNASCIFLMTQDRNRLESLRDKFRMLQAISAMNENSCIGVDSHVTLEKNKRESQRCHLQCSGKCLKGHDYTTIRAHHIGWVIMHDFKSIEDVSNLLHSFEDRSHLCGVWYCDVPGHQISENNDRNAARKRCHNGSK